MADRSPAHPHLLRGRLATYVREAHPPRHRDEGEPDTPPQPYRTPVRRLANPGATRKKGFCVGQPYFELITHSKHLSQISILRMSLFLLWRHFNVFLWLDDPRSWTSCNKKADHHCRMIYIYVDVPERWVIIIIIFLVNTSKKNRSGRRQGLRQGRAGSCNNIETFTTCAWWLTAGFRQPEQAPHRGGRRIPRR